MRSVSIAAAIVASCACLGCSGPTERGWMGGTYQQARAGGHSLLAPPSPRTVRPLPQDVAADQKGAIFVSGVYENTPVAESGIRQGDLIISVAGTPVTSLTSFRKTIDQMKPGAVLRVTTYRDGTFEDRSVVIGQEKLGESGQGCAGLGLFFDLAADLLPDPSFNIFGLLGYQQWDHRADLRSPEYALARRADNREGTGPSRGWALYLGLVRVGYRREVIEQSPFSEAGNINARAD